MKSYIKAISYYLPEKAVTNDELEHLHPDWGIHELSEHTGVKTRYYSADDETAADMAVKAAEKLFEENPQIKDKIDFVLFCTHNSDYVAPASACLIQNRLGLSNSVGAVDINQGCTGYIYSLSLAKGLIESGSARNVLMLTAETITKWIHPEDKSSVPLFGDGATANYVVANKDVENSSVNNFVFGTDGKGFKNLFIEYYGARNRLPEKIFEVTDKLGNKRLNTSFYMNGSSVFLFSIKRGPKVVKDVLERNNLKLEDIDMFIFHQANKMIVETIGQRLGIPPEKNYSYIENCGNTVASTIPIALKNAWTEKKVKRGDRVLIAAFGIGYSWGATIINL